MAPGTRRKVRTTRSSQADQELSAEPAVTRRESLNMEKRDENKPDEPHNSDGGNDRVLDPPILQAKRTKTARARQSKLSDVSNRRGENKALFMKFRAHVVLQMRRLAAIRSSQTLKVRTTHLRILLRDRTTGLSSPRRFVQTRQWTNLWTQEGQRA